jgi:hypothetical protein
MPESSKTCALSISSLQRWRSDGDGSFPVNDRNDDGSFPGYTSEYARQDDDVISVLQRWRSDGSFSVDDWNDDDSFRDDVIPRKSISLPPVLRKIRSLHWKRSHSLQSKKARSSQPLRWRILCCSKRTRSDSNTSRDDGTANLFADDEMPLLDWSELTGGRWSEDWTCEY